MTYKFVVKQRLHNNDVVNTLSMSEATGFALPTPERCAELIADAWSAHMVPVLSDEWTMTEIVYYDTAWLPGTPAIDVTPASLPLVGGAAVFAMPNQVSCLINWKCNDGPPHRGRTNLAGVGANQVGADGVWVAGTLAAAAGLAFDLIVLIDPLGPRARLTLISTNSQVVPAGTEALVTTSNVNPIPATQRRRRLGVGS